MIEINIIADIQDAVKTHPRVFPFAGKSKTALSTPPENSRVLNFQPLSGILEYLPSEYTFTALAGTPLTVVEEALAEHGQYLPFDPPLAQKGATIGGTVAAGLSGSGRYRYGGVRDFIIGVRFVDGQGRLVQGGGKVVKNAAGFDLSKLMVGSLGRFGILAELSFKVFPQPKRYTTLKLTYDAVDVVIETVQRLFLSSFDIEALDFAPIASSQSKFSLWIRLGGLDEVLSKRITYLQDWLNQNNENNSEPLDMTVVDGPEEQQFWTQVNHFDWLPDGASLIKVPVSPKKVKTLEFQLSTTGAVRHYAVGGNVVWIAWPNNIEEIDRILAQSRLSGLVVLGNAEQVKIGRPTDALFVERVKQALDPENKFGEL